MKAAFITKPNIVVMGLVLSVLAGWFTPNPFFNLADQPCDPDQPGDHAVGCGELL